MVIKDVALDCCTASQEKGGDAEKVVRFILKHEFFDLIKEGKKCNELRAASDYWQKRIPNATHCIFSKAFNGVQLPKKKIDKIEVIAAENVHAHGGPEPGSKMFADLFGGTKEIFVVHFTPFSEEEIQHIPDKKAKAAKEAFHSNAEKDVKKQEVLDPDNLFRPSKDDKVICPKELAETKRRDVQFPESLLNTFIDSAWSNSPTNEFMGWLTGNVTTMGKGKDKKQVVVIDGLFLPKQAADQWNVWEPGDDQIPHQMLTYLQDSESNVVGWVHSHPTFDSFLSSVDLHTQHMLQREQPLAVAIVIDKNKKARVMRISEAGMEVVSSCGHDPHQFHEHDASHEEMVVDLPYLAHQSGKLAKFTFYDENASAETLSFRGLNPFFH